MNKKIVIILCIMILASSSILYADQERTPDWTHMHGDAYHTGYSSHEIPPPLELLWEKDFAPSPYANVVACWDGNTPKLFVGDVDEDGFGGASLYCLEPSTGRILWKHSIGKGDIPASPAIYTTAFGQKRVITVSSGRLNDGLGVVLHCLTTDGDVVWKKDLSGSSCQSSPTVQNGYIYVATAILSRDNSEGGYLFKLNADNGNTVWRSEKLPDAPVVASPSVVDGRVFIACSRLGIGSFDGAWLGAYLRGAVYVAVDDDTGDVVDELDYGDMRMDILTVYHNGEIIISGKTSQVYVRREEWPPGSGVIWEIYDEEPINHIARLDPETLKTKWRKYPRVYEMRSGLETEIYAHSPVVSGDWILTGSDQGMIYAYNTKNPLKNWNYQLAVGSNGPQGVRVCMATSDNYIYLNTGDTPPNCSACNAKFKIIDIETGSELWNYNLSAPGRGGVTIFDQYVYTFDREKLYCFTRGQEAKLMVDPTEIDLGEIPKGQTDHTQFKVWNGGDGFIVGTVDNIVPYMELSSEQFMQKSNPKTFICTIDTSRLTIGETYNINVLVKCNTTGEEEFVIITFTVTGQPILQVDPGEIDFGTVEKGTYSESECYIDNIGQGTLKGTVTSDATWCVIEYTTWEGNHKRLMVTADTTMLDYNRDYKANIFFESNGGTDKVVVTVQTKQKGPKLRVYPTEQIFTDVDWGDQLTGTFAIDNAGILTLEGVLEPSADWIHLDKRTFSIDDEPTNITISIDTKLLPENETTNAEIMVKSNAGNRIVYISVQIKPRPPLLKVEPPTLFFNQCQPNEYYEEVLTVSNIGSGILTGDITVSTESTWMDVGQESFDIHSAPLKIKVRISTKGMPKGSSHTSRITIESNGGTDEVGVVVVIAERVKRTIELWIGSKQAKVDGQPHDLDWPPYINNGTTMVPARFVAEAFGCVVDFYPKHVAVEEIYITRGTTIINLFIGKNRALINNDEVYLDIPPEIKNGRTFVPIRFISEMFGADVKWDSQSQKVTISYYED